MLAHVYLTEPYPANAISGHAYSVDGITWTMSPIEPYSNAVVRTDGTVSMFATLERPKLLFSDDSDPYRPTAIFNGASPYWNASNASDPCSPCSWCSRCKVTWGGPHGDLDWTYTLVRPIENVNASGVRV